MDESPQPPKPQQRLLRRSESVTWCAIALCILLCSLTPHVSIRLYITDVIANFAAHVATCAVILCFATLVRKQRTSTLLLALSAISAIVSVVSTPRAEWTRAQQTDLSVLVFNTQSVGDNPEMTLKLILGSNADLVALPEMSLQLMHELETNPRVQEHYPYFHLEQNRRPGMRTLLSRWPIDELFEQSHRTEWALTPAPSVFAARVQTPSGDVGILVSHPLAPKNPQLWKWGNAAVNAAISVINDAHALGIPLVLATDMNATPSAWRSRAITRRTGLRRAKPVLRATGTWPAWLFWPLQIAIDDVWVSHDVRIVSWNTLQVSGSDHLPVMVELSLNR
ncbi:MAG: hypothetical protein H6815_05265 [Phycisphaeraceae bacterium]|nr:hypothetical protein [Phycisphaerales bacterium]MCB9859846.1 hypothetical protein [Phycisphaeraceae bacterium]